MIKFLSSKGTERLEGIVSFMMRQSKLSKFYSTKTKRHFPDVTCDTFLTTERGKYRNHTLLLNSSKNPIARKFSTSKLYSG